jgi:hypothetical protein
MARPKRLRLSLGPTSIQKGCAFLVAAVMVSTGIFLVTLMVVVVRNEVLKRADDWIVTAAVMLVVIIPGLYVLAAVTLVVLPRVTSGVWLRGTTLNMRVGFETTSVDLATADIQRGPEGKTLLARDPISGSTVTVRLRGPGSVRLPSAQLRAIAEAICHGQARTVSTDDPLVVADELRALARS